MGAFAKVLLVEDNPSVAGTYAGILRSAGHHVDWASNEGAARSYLRENTYNVAFVDLNLSGDDLANKGGLDIITYIDKLNEGTKTFAVSGSTEARDVVRSFRSGAVDFIMKSEIKSKKDLLEPLENSTKGQRFNLLGKFDRLTPLLAAPEDTNIWESNLIGTIGEDFKTCNAALEEAFTPLLPILRKRDGSAAIKFDRGKNSLCGLFWSKGRGSAVWVSLASRKGELDTPPVEFAGQEIELGKTKTSSIKIKLWRLPDVKRDLFAETVWDTPWRK
jgi:CheY-like chemotaxis protein